MLAKVDELVTANQHLELALVSAKSSVAAQEQVVAGMLQRFSIAATDPEMAAKKAAEGAKLVGKEG